ncbi:hypothetical protein BDZ89DRAFT_1220764 [Hymenopellis radicata]|nr:hypothetical protein BDZ89DRAFT_1220764 [Hymenopellis radicata]
MDVWAGRGGTQNFAQEFLYELLRLKGRGKCRPDACAGCNQSGSVLYRCRECAPSRLICKTCCVSEHATKPLHLIRKWDGDKFIRIPLQRLGLRVYLGHEDGSQCFMPRQSERLVVIHTNGIHEVSVRYCNCLQAIPRRQQLLRFGWYPGTVRRPATCATLDALDLFHALTLNGKLSAYAFYKSLIYLTDALGIKVPKKRYQPFLRMIRQYRHLMLMMRAGKGSQKDGASVFKPGELVLKCPACPIPSVNLPPNWKERVDQGFPRYLYRKTISLDACFRLTNLHRSNQATDPSLHPGAGFMLDDAGDSEYGAHVLRNASQKDMNTCSGFRAIAHADSKNNTGLRCTGVVAALCSRHEMVSAQSVGNLQKGERFCNSDFVACTALRDDHDLKEVCFSYDIACQWIKNFLSRMETLPEHLQLPETMQTMPAIPKAHAPCHQIECQVEFAMGIQPGMGRTDGEAIERVWAFIRMCAASIKEMGPGSRADTLDDQFQFHNWCKLINLGKSCMTTLKRLVKARAQSLQQGTLHTDFTSHLPADTVARWTEGIEAWERDRHNPDIENPYAQVVKHETECQARYRMRESERLAIEQGAPQLHDTLPTGCLTLGFSIEQQQQKLRLLTDGEGTLTQAQASEIQRKRVALSKQIRLFRSSQLVYMPGVAAELARETVARRVPIDVEDQKLWMPSHFDANVRETACLPGFSAKEKELRITQCNDALHGLRDCERGLRTYAAFRRDETDGQGVLTRAQSAIKTIEARRDFNANKYRRCRRALERLDPGGVWSIELRPLRQCDVTNMAGGGFDIDVLMPLGEGAAELSWIWANETGHGPDAVEGKISGCHMEWLKSRARSNRWSEDVNLLKEEMRRIAVTLEARAVWWDAHRESEDTCLELEIKEGIRAYAAQQACVQRTLVDSFGSIWEAGGIEVDDSEDWNETNEPEEEDESDDESIVGDAD